MKQSIPRNSHLYAVLRTLDFACDAHYRVWKFADKGYDKSWNLIFQRVQEPCSRRSSQQNIRKIKNDSEHHKTSDLAWSFSYQCNNLMLSKEGYSGYLPKLENLLKTYFNQVNKSYVSHNRKRTSRKTRNTASV